MYICMHTHTYIYIYIYIFGRRSLKFLPLSVGGTFQTPCVLCFGGNGCWPCVIWLILYLPRAPGTSECRKKKGMELALLRGLGQDEICGLFLSLSFARQLFPSSSSGKLGDDLHHGEQLSGE